MRIPLTQGKFAEIDDEDYELVSAHRWFADYDGFNTYARANTPAGENGGRGHIRMHRLIMGFPDCKVDHIDGNGLNNRRGNLRLASDKDNARNRRAWRTPKASRFKGVKRDQQKKRWSCNIHINGKTRNVYGFDSEIDAAVAYDLMARHYFGEFAHTNFSGSETKTWEQVRTELLARAKSGKTSVFHGVHRNKSTGKWIAQVHDGHRQIRIGSYDCETDAAVAYNERAIVLGRKIINDIENRNIVLRSISC